MRCTHVVRSKILGLDEKLRKQQSGTGHVCNCNCKQSDVPAVINNTLDFSLCV